MVVVCNATKDPYKILSKSHSCGRHYVLRY